MSVPGPPRDGRSRQPDDERRPRVVRVPAATAPAAGDGAVATRPTASGSRHTELVRTDRGDRAGRQAPMAWPTWPPEPFPGPTEVTPMRPASVRVLTTKVRNPPTHTGTGRWQSTAEAQRAGPPATRPPVEMHDPAAARPVAVAEQPSAGAWRGGESPRGIRWFVIAAVVVSIAAGGVVGALVRRDSPGRTVTTVAPAVPTSVSAATTTVPSTTVAPTTTAAVTRNVLGVAVGTPADAGSARPEERFAARLGVDDVNASPGTPAALYASWWKLLGGVDASAVASPNGFSVTDDGGQTVELSRFTFGADGNVADLVECVSVGDARPTCNTLSNVVELDPAAPVVGQSAAVTFRRFGELRLLRDRTVRFVTTAASQPVTAARSSVGDVRFDDHVLAFAVPAAAAPATVDVVLTYADGATETVTITG